MIRYRSITTKEESLCADDGTKHHTTETNGMETDDRKNN